MMRTLGLRRVAEQMWAETPPGRSRDVLDGFAAGVNLYLGELRSGHAIPPRGSELLLTPATEDWAPVDSLAVLRLMEMFLSFNADAETVSETSSPGGRFNATSFSSDATTPACSARLAPTGRSLSITAECH